ncbi:MAG TPA: ABC transporter permease [Pirellulales bacterium]|jgi:ribose transport system permease protein
MKKLLGLALFLVILYGLMLVADPGARSAQNHINLTKRMGLYGINALGMGILIISGGIDLSIGATTALYVTVMTVLMVDERIPPPVAMLITLALGAAIGLVNGLLVTRLKVQAFVVTLCGLFIYRGLARWLSGDKDRGLGNGFATFTRVMFDNRDVLGLPMSLVIFLVLCAIAAVFLHKSVYGRYLYAIGSNEQAAKYAGIPVNRYRTLAYVLCGTLSALFSIVWLAENKSYQPSQTGSSFELYAIAAAVLGGCSLRGGEGSVAGIMIGTAIIWILPTFTNMWGVPNSLQFTVIGAALLLGALIDETLRRRGLAKVST